MLYHLTKVKNVDSILSNGLKTKNGYVFLFDNQEIPYCEGFFRRDKWSNNIRLFSVRDLIAKNEVFLKEFALFEVNTDGLQLLPDVCRETISKYQYKVANDITPDRIKYVGNFSYKNFWDYPNLGEKYTPKGKIVKIGSFGFIEQ